MLLLNINDYHIFFISLCVSSEIELQHELNIDLFCVGYCYIMISNHKKRGVGSKTIEIQ